MPKEIVFGKYEAFWADKDHEQLPPDMAPTEGCEMWQSGAVIRWSTKGHVEIGNAFLRSVDHLERNPHYVQMDEEGLAQYIRKLQRAGRQAFGDRPW